jgi:hypothetical protein
MPYRLRDLTISKVALVPKGANPGAHIVLFKHDPSTPGPSSDPTAAGAPAPAVAAVPDAAPVSRALVSFAGPNSTWPINTPQDVTAVVRSLAQNVKVGLVARGQRERIKRRTIALAKAKGPKFESRLPPAWRVAKVQFTDVQSDYELMEKKEEAWEAISAYMDSLRLAMGMTLFAGDGPMSDIDKSIVQFRDAVATALADISEESTT